MDVGGGGVWGAGEEREKQRVNSSCRIIDGTLCVMAARGSPNREGNQSPAGRRREDQESSRGAALTLNPPSCTQGLKPGEEESRGRDRVRKEGSRRLSRLITGSLSRWMRHGRVADSVTPAARGGTGHLSAKIMLRGARPRPLIPHNGTILQINGRCSFASRPPRSSRSTTKQLHQSRTQLVSSIRASR